MIETFLEDGRVMTQPNFAGKALGLRVRTSELGNDPAAERANHLLPDPEGGHGKPVMPFPIHFMTERLADFRKPFP